MNETGEGNKISTANGVKPVVYVVSDSIGETAEFVVRAAASQFDGSGVEIKRVPYVSEKCHIAEIIDEAAGKPCIIAYTLVIQEMREALLQMAQEKGIQTVDIMGPMIQGIQKLTNLQPALKPGLLHQLDEQYFRKVEAIEFAVKYDDGKDPRGILHADVILIGVSRTSKTPVCMYLAHKRIKAANVPLVPEVAPPEELFQLPRRKVIGLTISPSLLNGIRTERLKTLGLAGTADYASFERIMGELEYADSIMKRVGCPIINVTNKAVEETAAKVLEYYYRGERNV
ncbi:pyruvate, phosphate dikinase/phosphoenolpyruvate synthase regulator [Heliobacillus mobilis]|uniref:Putative pyruvate, phosphate dikinase regulatory protein n=1 Tax=Heliobacterium mobile TaxID=28064 RepID=A0A6I3SME2_HELMO|nr:pyruvate, water dikinase regulatory protein [Heliobacterium mobile]MTV50158.1 pyruvate, phosphate dikinase/phosphoenolpyruvate synthase regulator [Heliobacterium mobile]